MSKNTEFTNDQVAILTDKLKQIGASKSDVGIANNTNLPELGVIFFSGIIDGQNPYELLLEVARYIDKAGFNAIWTPERHFTKTGGAYPNPAILAAALAMETKNVRLRAGSVNLPLHDPLRVVEEWSVVDQLSNGRVDIAVAPGWHIRDFVLQPDNFKDKFNILNNYREQVRRAWAGQPIERKDSLGDIHEITTYPRPIQPELPVWLTTSKREEAWEYAGRSGLNVLSALINFNPNELKNRIRIYREARKKAGMDPSTGIVSLMLHTYIDADESLAIERVRPVLTEYLKSFVSQHQTANQPGSSDKEETLKSLGEDQDDFVDMVFSRYVDSSSLIGDLRKVEAQLDEFSQMGVNEVACLVDFGLEMPQVLDSLNLLTKLIKRK